MANKAKKSTETPAPVTVEDHIHAGKAEAQKKKNAVNEALKFPVGENFEKDLSLILESDCEANGETVVIALIDFDNFLHINDDFGVKTGDQILIDTGLYIKKNLPKDAALYRIGGDEFGIIFKGETEREEIFLFLNDLKNGFDIKTPDGAAQSITIGMATAFADASRCPELIRKADGALYRAKTNGRNKVAMAREEKMIPKTSHYTQDQLQRLAKLSKHEGIGEAILLREALDMLLKKSDNCSASVMYTMQNAYCHFRHKKTGAGLDMSAPVFYGYYSSGSFSKKVSPVIPSTSLLALLHPSIPFSSNQNSPAPSSYCTSSVYVSSSLYVRMKNFASVYSRRVVDS